MVSVSFPAMSLALVLMSPPKSPLKGTGRLEAMEDPASEMIDGIDRFLLKELDRAGEVRERNWEAAFKASGSVEEVLEGRRQRLFHILGVRDQRPERPSMELVASLDRASLRGQNEKVAVHAVRWLSFGDVHGEGLLLTPLEGELSARAIVVPDADQSPEQLVGLLPGNTK